MQDDLFSFTHLSPQPHSTKQPVLDKYRLTLRIDHVVIMFIFWIVLLAVVYAYGFERGQKKEMSVAPKATNLLREKILDKSLKADTIVFNSAQITSPEVENVVEKGRSQAIEIKPESITLTDDSTVGSAIVTDAKLAGKYTIQLVTYKTDKAAQKQIDRLAQKGYEGFIVPSGSFLLVCVNAFESRDVANKTLQALRAQKLAPADAYIRTMPA